MLKGRIGQDTFRLKIIGWLTLIVAQRASDSVDYDNPTIRFWGREPSAIPLCGLSAKIPARHVASSRRA
jgi:hypothetical protein